jgi:hypothetical protein
MNPNKAYIWLFGTVSAAGRQLFNFAKNLFTYEDFLSSAGLMPD